MCVMNTIVSIWVSQANKVNTNTLLEMFSVKLRIHFNSSFTYWQTLLPGTPHMHIDRSTIIKSVYILINIHWAYHARKWFVTKHLTKIEASTDQKQAVKMPSLCPLLPSIACHLLLSPQLFDLPCCFRLRLIRGTCSHVNLTWCQIIMQYGLLYVCLLMQLHTNGYFLFLNKVI